MTAAPVLAKSFKVKVAVKSGPNAGQSHVFEKPIITIGRGPENDLVFADDPKMSRTHAEIRIHAGQLMVRNISQRNSILVNGERVEERQLSGVSTVQIGDTVLQVQTDQPESVARLVPTQANPVKAPPPVSKKQDFSSLAQSQPQTFTAPTPPPPSRPRPRVATQQNGEGNRVRFYLIVAIVGGLVFWLLSDNTNGKKAEVRLRTEGDVARAIEQSAEAIQEIKKQQQTTGQDSLQYKAAQEHYIRGFRDYRQGQYARAMQSFQAALSFYPNHELARKYLVQSQRKFEAQIDFNMAQGRKYHQKQNYKMCQSSFASVMIMVKDSTKPKYREAKQFYDECSLRIEGRF